jgi:hypothetical protein
MQANVYCKVTRKIHDFPPEQLQNLSAIVWLYLGNTLGTSERSLSGARVGPDCVAERLMGPGIFEPKQMLVFGKI